MNELTNRNSSTLHNQAPDPSTDVQPFFALDIGGTNWRLILVRGSQTLDPIEFEKCQFKGRNSDDPLSVVSEILRIMSSVCTESELEPAELELRCSFAGALDASGTVISWPNRSSWTGFDFRRAFELFGNLVVEDDGYCATLGEQTYGAGRAFNNVFVVSLGTGIGAGFVFSGVVQRIGRIDGKTLGHFRTGSHTVCDCGRTGCLQSLMRNGFDEKGSERFCELVADIVSLHDLDAVILTGGVVAANHEFAESLRVAIIDEMSPGNCQVLLSRNPDSSSLLGAAALTAIPRRRFSVVFDLDGTIIDSREVARIAFTKAYGEVVGSGSPPLARFESLAGGSLSDIFLKMGLPEEMTPSFERDARALMTEIPLLPGVVPLLNRLRNTGIRIALFTGKDRLRTIEILKNLRIYSFFDVILTSSDHDECKPSPQGLIILCEKLRISQSEMIMVGDAESDMLAAKSAGVNAVGCLWAGNTNSSNLLEAGATALFNDTDACWTYIYGRLFENRV